MLTPIQQALLLFTVVGVIATLYWAQYFTVEIVLVCTVVIVFLFEMYAIQKCQTETFTSPHTTYLLQQTSLLGFHSKSSAKKKNNNSKVWAHTADILSNTDGYKYHALIFKHDPPAIVPDAGISMINNSLRGPKCDQLGLDVNQFTFTACIKSNAAPEHDVSLIKVYANPQNKQGDNAFELRVVPNDENKFFFAAHMGLQETEATSVNVTLNPDEWYLLACVIRGKTIKLYWMPLSSKRAVSNFIILDKRVDCDLGNTVTMSNKSSTFTQAPAGSWDYNLMELTLSNKAYDDAMVAEQVNGIKIALKSFDKEYVDNQKTRQEINALKKCPFDTATCQKCASVADWTSGLVTSIVKQESNACGNAINAYCKTNPDHKLCTCWDIGNPLYDTKCRHVRAIFDSSSSMAILPLGLEEGNTTARRDKLVKDKRPPHPTPPKPVPKMPVKRDPVQIIKEQKECKACKSTLPKKSFLDVIKSK
jgi:hypothetical protein